MYMKYILLICIILVTSISHTYASSGSTSAVILRPSLTAQMERQNKIIKKNVALARIEQAKNKKTATVQTPKKATPSSGKPTEKKSLTPTLTIPPVPQTNISTQNIQPQAPQTLDISSSIPWVDMNRVYSTWIGWYNDTRTTLWLPSYSYDGRLHATAHDWNTVFAGSRGTNYHERSPGDGYYNFQKIDTWFTERGINPKVINRAKHTENVWYGYYNCNSGDCTDALIESIRSTYDFYMSEKGKSYDAHYRSIVNPYFTKIGLDIIVVPSEKRYYLTVHYITE